jgi:DNA-binding response OmpR family regulator
MKSQLVRVSPHEGYIPIIMVTALTATPDKVKGLMYGADESLSSSVDLIHLQTIVGSVLEKDYRCNWDCSERNDAARRSHPGRFVGLAPELLVW